MKITVLANRDVASNLALNHLLPALHGEHSLRVYLSSHVGGDTEMAPQLKALKFFEQTLFNELLFPALGVGRGELLSFEGLGNYSVAPVEDLNRINSEESLAILAAGEPELVLSIRYGGILREQAIAIPSRGVINLHSGLLPDYRGVMATFRALLNGESQIGTTIHNITDPGIDTGDIIATTTLPVRPGKSYLWHVLALYPEACAILAECVQSLARGDDLPAQPQPTGGNYYSFPDTAELQAFAEQGWTLYDAEEITTFAQAYIGEPL